MLPDRVSNPAPLTYESGALPIALRGPATLKSRSIVFLHGGVDLYCSRCMSEPNFMALALIGYEKQG